jgi:hypothetical protein
VPLDAYDGYNQLYLADRKQGPIREAACWSPMAVDPSCAGGTVMDVAGALCPIARTCSLRPNGATELP